MMVYIPIQDAIDKATSQKFKDHEARIKALEDELKTKVAVPRAQVDFTQADLDAAVKQGGETENTRIRTALTGRTMVVGVPGLKDILDGKAGDDDE